MLTRVETFARGWRYIPLIVIALYLFSTMTLFFAGPYKWPLRETETLTYYLVAILLAVTIGYGAGSRGGRHRMEFKSWRRVFAYGAISSCIILFPSAYIYTGKLPWDVIPSLLDQGQAYKEFQERVQDADASRGSLVLSRILTDWAVYAVVPFAILRWNQLSWTMCCGMAATIAAALIFSLLRGTDQGTFDLMFVAGASFLIKAARTGVDRRIRPTTFMFNRRGLLALVTSACALTAALYLFVDRKIQRYDGAIETLCIGEDYQICADNTGLLENAGSDWVRFGAAMITAYAAQGYYGMALSLDRPFDSTWGLGHSPALTRAYELLTKDTETYTRSYTYRLRDDAWSDKYQWSTMYTWLANDVGFPGAVIVIGLLGWIAGRAWRDAIVSEGAPAAIVFCFMCQTFAYAPANLQIALGLDTYAAFFIWLGIWVLTGYRRRRSGACESRQ